ncbi:MAG: UDP-3-O-(3-hydroxymyristoyl) glucosamine N-acyltransferase [Ignavibacteria bacterium]|nr:UDP-3-O-(3-hydroxymyristoyl) glucosamine N-acyltransferase [Ignavibacteria bacterium]
MNKQIAIKEIIDFLGVEVIHVFGEIENVFVMSLKPAEYVDAYSLDWIGSLKRNKQEIAEQTKAPAIICDPTVSYTETLKKNHKVLIHVQNPKMSIAMIADRFFIQKLSPGIHPSAFIHPGAVISASAYIGAGCVIGECVIGDDTIIYPNVTIYDNVKIGSQVIIQAGVVIGTDGLGCERKKDGTLIKFSHLGGVVIGNNVEIGANSQIARGALSDTIIGDGTKMNGLCFIAHNCVLGKNVWITGNTMLAGSVVVEENATIFSKVIVREQTRIGKNSVIGMGSVVTKDIPENETWFGNPAKKNEK